VTNEFRVVYTVVLVKVTHRYQTDINKSVRATENTASQQNRVRTKHVTLGG